MILALPTLRRRRAEHDQFPLVADFVEEEDIHATVTSSDFDVAITWSVLIHDLDDVDPTLAPIKTSRHRSDICMRLNLNTHELSHGIGVRDSVLVLTMSNVVHSPAVHRQHLCRDPA